MLKLIVGTAALSIAACASSTDDTVLTNGSLADAGNQDATVAECTAVFTRGDGLYVKPWGETEARVDTLPNAPHAYGLTVSGSHALVTTSDPSTSDWQLGLYSLADGLVWEETVASGPFYLPYRVLARSGHLSLQDGDVIGPDGERFGASDAASYMGATVIDERAYTLAGSDKRVSWVDAATQQSKASVPTGDAAGLQGEGSCDHVFVSIDATNHTVHVMDPHGAWSADLPASFDGNDAARTYCANKHLLLVDPATRPLLWIDTVEQRAVALDMADNVASWDVVPLRSGFGIVNSAQEETYWTLDSKGQLKERDVPGVEAPLEAQERSEDAMTLLTLDYEGRPLRVLRDGNKLAWYAHDGMGWQRIGAAFDPTHVNGVAPGAYGTLLTLSADEASPDGTYGSVQLLDTENALVVTQPGYLGAVRDDGACVAVRDGDSVALFDRRHEQQSRVEGVTDFAWVGSRSSLKARAEQ